MKFDSETYLICCLDKLLCISDIALYKDYIDYTKAVCGGKVEGLQFGSIKEVKTEKTGSIIFSPKSNGNVIVDNIKVYYDARYSEYAPNVVFNVRLDSMCIKMETQCSSRGEVVIIINDKEDLNRGIFYVGASVDKEVFKYNEAKVSYFDGEVLDAISNHVKNKYEIEKIISSNPKNLEKLGFIADKEAVLKISDNKLIELVSRTFKEATKEKFDSWVETIFEKEKVKEQVL